MKIIEIKNLMKQYKQGTKTISAVNDISIDVKKGDFLVIIGPSGSGKSTLLQLIGGLDKPTKGELKIENEDLAKMCDKKITNLRQKKIGFIFQSFNLIPTLTAKQNVEAAIAERSKQDTEKTREALKRVGLLEREGHLPSLLSGGEQQRVAIARALINKPQIILADEPTGNLDTKTGEEILDILEELNKNGETIILITHSEYAKKYATRIVEIRDGKISESAKSKAPLN
ncbi:MAG: ABC transporter, ATP-binding protein [candidate division CPR2 bacterium GW2011_GWC1_41_48]|uniref:ABC transporter, ATP-binding protein n=1 Tax=candidate division CPR2 bacterium GW2011_GWC1_41_48 TaxID=1618344 RepID=A0A0G0WBN8_UNCC2|nr:MAG: ABC transporter, ATP-binding protein [candidate division CPR2 bacterium GW2011_GWC2_39_35]KKR27660.1 MAG: ABC transporter, ATP-binding protein [candidate division CPR2 bacterium GW2011_GWD1_39_7]KKR28995.1 MAG: ABC transporter, ATP-binding protein [candidate division CPR2 bacterium GW2011_GWD2_39_7]KKS09492.1 MAG: ABC transporter, ATP-binding protein [candidate division CPR2 bacterium GW2011_GWC1_41_48]OGB59530.1 MAG: macrolide ABC transporter ATP-binding protein [candidate division CPR